MTPLATAQAGLLWLWVAFTAVALAGIAAAIVWAVRSGQFADQDRARYLPLESGIPDEVETQARPTGGERKEDASDVSS